MKKPAALYEKALDITFCQIKSERNQKHCRFSAWLIEICGGHKCPDSTQHRGEKKKKHHFETTGGIWLVTTETSIIKKKKTESIDRRMCVLLPQPLSRLGPPFGRMCQLPVTVCQFDRQWAVLFVDSRTQTKWDLSFQTTVPCKQYTNPQIFSQLAQVAHIPGFCLRVCVCRAKVKAGGSSSDDCRSSTLSADFFWFLLLVLHEGEESRETHLRRWWMDGSLSI